MRFFSQLLRHPKSIGRITPTPRLVVLAMLAQLNFRRALRVVELGGGTGAVTKRLLKKLRPGAQLFVFESNPVFVKILRRIRDSRLIVIESSAENMMHELIPYGVHKVEYVVSSLPMALMPTPTVEGIIKQAYSILRPRGKFIQLHHTTLMKRIYRRCFGNISVSFVPFGLPPAFVMVCRKQVAG